MQSDGYVVHVIDDEEQVRQSLAFLLTTMGFTVRLHATATEFLASVPGIDRACLVTDLMMPDMSGMELLERLRDMHAAIPTVIITGQADVPAAVAAMKAGAADFIEKPFDGEVLASAIRRAANRLDNTERVIDAVMLRARLDQLTERERQVLAAVVAGLPNKAIAYDLNISPRTVEVHRANVMAKMHARSLPELVRMSLAIDMDDGRQ